MASIPGRIFRVLMIDRRAKQMTLNKIIGELQKNHTAIMDKLSMAADNEANRKQLSHVIGIERWGQNRLRVALGAPLNMEEYNHYRPKREVAMAELTKLFDEMRQETLAIAEELTAVSNISHMKVEHNNMGSTTIPSWLYYLDMHSTFELRNVK